MASIGRRATHVLNHSVGKLDQFLIWLVISTLCAGIWAERTSTVPSDGLPIANRQLVCYRSGCQVLVALVSTGGGGGGSVPLTGNEPPWLVAQMIAQAKTIDKSWGHPACWLELPEAQLNLWWPFGTAESALVFKRFVGNRSGPNGFPVIAGAEPEMPIYIRPEST